MKSLLKILLLIIIAQTSQVDAQNSVARDWNDELLEAIRNDFARPTIHARNLFHSSVLMYDAWAIFDTNAETVFLGKTFGGYTCTFDGVLQPANNDIARHEIISYAMFRLLSYRFQNSPGAATVLIDFETLNKYK
jgi:hypothetical protein